MKILISVLLTFALSAMTVTRVTVDAKDSNNVIYTSEELSALKEFRELMGPLPQPYMNTDGYLINWIRGSESGAGYKIYRNATYSKYIFAQGFDLDKAAQKLKHSLAWRKENNIDNVLSEDFSDLKRKFPFDITRKDLNGRPVVLLDVSSWDIKKAVEGASPTESIKILRYLDYLLESVAAKARQHGTTDYTYLSDAAGFNVDTHACPKCQAFYTYFPQHFETHYPQMTKNLLYVNAPKDFDPFSKIISSNLSPASKKGHKTYDNNKDKWLKEVGKIISVDQIPQHYIEGTTTTTTKKPFVFFPWANTCAGCKVST